ncbi:MAG TPA: helix-turn-helix domain-containing protein [Steroidobacteraceae bacterium]|nr:helix-turn-helix domain-containing protein [Steroidobacteraceae bacterium]
MMTPEPTPAPLHARTLLSVDQVAGILKLHVRTVRNYVRQGALRATRIGKQYRIDLADLEAFTGRPVESHDERLLAPGTPIQTSCVFTVEGVTPALASRVSNSLLASAGGPRAPGQWLAVTTTYEVQFDRLRILLAADLATLRSYLGLIEAVLERPEATPAS